MRRFRFGVSAAPEPGAPAAAWAETARRAEAWGYDVLLTADHLGRGAGTPLVPLAAAGQVTSTLRLGTLVLNNDFHHPLLLARDAAALDELCGGRLELGLGAGYARAEYDAAGITFDTGATRVARLAESVAVLDAALRGAAVEHTGRHHRVVTEPIVDPPPQRPRMPLLIGGHGRRLLSLAARRAEIVGLTGLVARDGWIGIAGLSAATAAGRVAFARAEAGGRAAALEFNALVQHVVVTDDPVAEAERIAGRHDGLDPAELADSPFVLLGSTGAITEALQRHRETTGVSYFVVFERAMEAFAPVVARVAGT